MERLKCVFITLKADQLKFPLNESDVTVHQTTAQLAQQKQKACVVIYIS